MKRSLEKSRSAAASLAARDVIPCNQAVVEMGKSYDSPPVSWITATRTCTLCRATFVVSAAEQQFWYEELRIPYVVSISHCLSCRRRQQARRRIISRLAELMPLADQGLADERQLRETVLTIAEGSIRRDVTRVGSEPWVLGHHAVLNKGSAFINQLRKGNRPQHDLLAIQQHFQERLGNATRMQRIADEIAARRADSAALDKAFRAMATWLAAPTKRTWERIIDPPRL